MKKIVLLLAVCLIALPALAAASEEEFPYLSADIYFHALLVHQQNLAAAGGIFGNSLGADSGNFNDEVADEENRQVLESRFRLFLTGNMSPHVRGRFTFEVNPEYGREQGFGDFRVNNAGSGTGELRMKHFYLEVEHPIGGFLGYRIGRQSYGTPNSLIVGDPDAEGATLWYRHDSFGRLSLAGAIVDTRETQEIEDVYFHLKYQFPANRFVNGSLYMSALNVRDRTAGPNNGAPELCRGGGSAVADFLLSPSTADAASMSRARIYWVGTELTHSIRGMVTSLNAIVDFGSIEAAENYDTQIESALGYLAMLDLSYGRGWWRFGGAAVLVSGHDPDPEADQYTGYLDVNAGFGFTRFFFVGSPYLVTAGFASPAVQGSGLLAGKVYTRLTPVPWLAVNLQAAALAAQYNRPQLAGGGGEYESNAENAGSYYGSEVDFWLEFTPMDKIHWLAEVDYFHPGNYFQGTATDDDPGNGFLETTDPAWRLATGLLFY